MHRVRTAKLKRARGMVMILSMVFVILFASMGFAMFTMATRNVRVADNQRDANRALESALSGLEVMKYYMNQVVMPGSTPITQRFSVLRVQVEANLALGRVLPCRIQAALRLLPLQPINNDGVSHSCYRLRGGADADGGYELRSACASDGIRFRRGYEGALAVVRQHSTGRDEHRRGGGCLH